MPMEINRGQFICSTSTTGNQTFKLLADDGAAGDLFGTSVALHGNFVVVSTPKNDQVANNAGAAYLFDVTTGQQLAKIVADDAAEYDYFGGELYYSRGIAISGTTVIVAADKNDDQGDNSGSVYVFDISDCVAMGDDITPVSFTVTRGEYVSGGIQELEESDNSDLSLRRLSSDIQSRTELEVKALSSTETPSSLEVTLEGAVFARSTVNQTIELFDYAAAAWEAVDTRAATRFMDSVVTVSLTGDLSRFVEPGTMCMKARIRYQSPIARQQFSSNIDQFIWTIGQ